MSRIFITGDIHGTIDIHKLTTKNFDCKDLTKDDFLIICGDFGLVWWIEGGEYWKEDQWWLDWLEDKPWTTLFVDGNHENHNLLNDYPTEMWHGGKVHRIRDSVIHLMRGEIYELDGLSFFTMGGAYSCDKEYRVKDISWWEEEVPDRLERRRALDNLEKHSWQVDYIISHCAPSEVVETISVAKSILHPPDEYTNWLQRQIADRVDFTGWFFGHYHLNMPLCHRYWVLYDKIYDLKAEKYIEKEPKLKESV